YEERFEEKDAYDLVYCLMYYHSGPFDVATEFAERCTRWPDEALLPRVLEILRARFVGDDRTPGTRKDGPVSYARFLADPGRPDLDARRRQDAAAVVEQFLAAVDAQRGRVI
ncbi:MAG: antitoxin, partial [Dehalococcoidia bacterium]